MLLSELDGARKGARQDAIDGRPGVVCICKTLGFDTLFVLTECASKEPSGDFKHDTVMMLRALSWSDYDGNAEVLRSYFGASGTRQINAVFSVAPQSGHAGLADQVMSAKNCRALPRL